MTRWSPRFGPEGRRQPGPASITFGYHRRPSGAGHGLRGRRPDLPGYRPHGDGRDPELFADREDGRANPRRETGGGDAEGCQTPGELQVVAGARRK